MTTYYVSNSTDNDYGMGDDGTGDGSKAAPYLTLEYVMSNVVTDNDTIIINDGTYNKTTGHNIRNATGLTILPENDDMVTLTITNTTQVLIVWSTGTGATIGAIKVDGQDQSANVMVAISALPDLTCEGTSFINYTSEAISDNEFRNLTLTECHWDSATANGRAVYWHPNGVGVLTITGGTLNQLAMTASGDGIRAEPEVPGCSTIINGLEVNLATTTGHLIPIRAAGNAVTHLDHCVVDIKGASNADGIRVASDAIDDSDDTRVSYNTVTSDNFVGRGVTVGEDSDSPTNANSVNNARVFCNEVTNFSHGVIGGAVTGAKLYANKINASTLGVILKRAIDSEATGNVTIDCADASGNGSLLLKGCTDSFFANNLVVYTGGATVPLATGFGSTSSVGAVTASNSGCGYYNNLIRAEAEINKYVYDKDIASDTVFEGNHYYATVAPGNASPWTSSTASYATIALWNGDGDVGANVAEVEGVDPEIKDFDNGEYEVTATAMIGVGYAHKVTLPFINGYDGEPFPTSDIDVGAVQTTNGPFHPVNL